MIGYILIKCNINYDILLLYYTSKEKKYIYINIYIYKFIYKITIIISININQIDIKFIILLIN